MNKKKLWTFAFAIFVTLCAIPQNSAWAQCSYSVLPINVAISRSGDIGDIVVNTSATTCAWTANASAASAAWINITSGSNGIGNGTVFFSVAQNKAATPRTGSIIVAGHPVTIIQDGDTCAYAAMELFTSTAVDTGEIMVYGSANCAWTADSQVPWITITQGQNGTGTGIVKYAMQANPDAERSGIIIVAGVPFFFIQETGICTFSLDASTFKVAGTGGNGKVTVSPSSSTCAWNATSKSSWIKVNNTGGTGTGTVSFSVSGNPSSLPRSGSITVGGVTVSITQDGIPCTYTINPLPVGTNPAFMAPAATSTLGITSPDNCPWTASSAASWITINTKVTGPGSGTLSYSVAANPSIQPRSGNMTVAGNTVTVTQGGLPTFYTLTLQTSGNGTGYFLLNGTTKVNGGTTLTYTSGTVLTLQEVPGNQCTWMGWSGGACSGVGTTCSVHMTSPITVIGKFNQNSR